MGRLANLFYPVVRLSEAIAADRWGFLSRAAKEKGGK